MKFDIIDKSSFTNIKKKIDVIDVIFGDTIYFQK